MNYDPDDLHGRQKFDEKMRKSKTKGEKARIKAADAQREIERLKRSERAQEDAEQAKGLLNQMQQDILFILKEISGCFSAHKDEWYERLNKIDLTRPGVVAELKELAQEVERERRLYMTGADDLRWTTAESAEEEKPSFSLDPVDLIESPMTGQSIAPALEEILAMERGLERHREDNERELSFIASSLASLISIRERYESLSR